MTKLAAGGLDDLFADDLKIALGDVEGFHAGEDEDPHPIILKDLFHVFEIKLRQPRLQGKVAVPDKSAPRWRPAAEINLFVDTLDQRLFAGEMPINSLVCNAHSFGKLTCLPAKTLFREKPNSLIDNKAFAISGAHIASRRLFGCLGCFFCHLRSIRCGRYRDTLFAKSDQMVFSD